MDFREFSEAYNEQVLQHSWGVAVSESSKSQTAQEYRQSLQNLINCLTAANAQVKQARTEFNKISRIDKGGAPFTKTSAYGGQDKVNRLVQLQQQLKTNVDTLFVQ